MIPVQEKQEKVLVYRAVNDEGIPVYTFRDERGFYIQVLYCYYKELGGRHPTDIQAVEFITKASSKLIDVLEERERADCVANSRNGSPL